MICAWFAGAHKCGAWGPDEPCMAPAGSTGYCGSHQAQIDLAIERIKAGQCPDCGEKPSAHWFMCRRLK